MSSEKIGFTQYTLDTLQIPLFVFPVKVTPDDLTNMSCDPFRAQNMKAYNYATYVW